jgi:hypothetical protein
MKNQILISIVVIICSSSASAQPYVDGGKTRHRFAQLNIGADYRLLSGNNTTSYKFINEELKEIKLSHQNEGRLIIGGTHFWGHADFNVAFPIASWGKGNFSSGIETALKFYPYRIENNKIRVFGGVSFNTTKYKHEEGARLVRTAFPIQLGATYNKGLHLFEIAASYNFKNNFNYYFTTNHYKQITTHPLWFTIGYKYMIETTVGFEKQWLDGSTKKATEILAEQEKLNGLTLAIGPSSAFYTRASSFNDEHYPFLDNHKISSIFPEFGLGYYWHKPDLHANLAYRSIKNDLSAYGFIQKSSRKALTAEVYKFLTDYHGFSLFAGPALSYEVLNTTLTEKGELVSSGKFSGFKPGITFGWDIRPNRIQNIYLRTNLRYFPNLNVEMAGGKQVALDNLEFNFIQLVVFPGRF